MATRKIENFSDNLNNLEKETTPIMKRTNPILMLTEKLHSEDAPRIYSIIINALTAATVTNVMKHLNKVRRSQVPHTDIPHLDERNEQDELARGEEVADAITLMQGFNPAEHPMKLAQICDGIRFHLYDHMHAWGEFDDDKHLVFEKAHAITDRINYNQPMSAQKYLDFRIDNADKLNEAELAIHAKRMNLPLDIIRAAMMEDAIRNKKMLIAMRADVLAEIQSMEDVYDESAFTALDIETQCGIVQKIADKLDQLYMRTIPRAIRSLEVAAELERIQRYHALAKQWLAENDAELQQAMLARRAA